MRARVYRTTQDGVGCGDHDSEEEDSMRLMAGMLIVMMALVVGCSKSPPDAAGTEEPAQEEPIYGENFEDGDAAAQPAEPVGEPAEEGPAEEPAAE
jgi:hypothetical protein